MSMIKSYAAKEAGGELEVYEYDPGELKPQDVEVQVDYCGICHSDLSMIDNEWGFSQYPLVAGHEVIGRVVALGSAAQDKGLQVGQRVGIGWTARSCGHCDACISGNQINCEQGAVPTIMNRGGFAEKLRADWQWVIPLPENIDIESAGPLLCGGITVFKPLLMHHITATSRVFMLLSVARVELPSENALSMQGDWQDSNVRMLFVASTLMWTCNTMYIIDMPLWISSDLGLPDKLAGFLMGTAAGLEIPAMILAGYYVKRYGKRRMMVIAVVAGVLFYTGLIFFQDRKSVV